LNFYGLAFLHRQFQVAHCSLLYIAEYNNRLGIAKGNGYLLQLHGSYIIKYTGGAIVGLLQL
jgi:hypothetical protein